AARLRLPQRRLQGVVADADGPDGDGDLVDGDGGGAGDAEGPVADGEGDDAGEPVLEAGGIAGGGVEVQAEEAGLLRAEPERPERAVVLAGEDGAPVVGDGGAVDGPVGGMLCVALNRSDGAQHLGVPVVPRLVLESAEPVGESDEFHADPGGKAAEPATVSTGRAPPRGHRGPGSRSGVLVRTRPPGAPWRRDDPGAGVP